MIKVRIPATSANLGSGFDSLGLALNLYNHVDMEESDHLDIRMRDGLDVPCDESNLIYRTARAFYELCGKELRGLYIEQESNIPMTKGLGSSSACIVAGILGANALLKGPMRLRDMIDFACRLEGHPDNVAPAFMGGFVASVFDGEKCHCVKAAVSDKLRFAAFIPDFEMSTEKARALLPRAVPYADAVFNLSRAALMSISLLSGDLENIRAAVDDRLHQPYRLGLIKDADKVFALSRSLNAYGTYLSGAGPTIMSILDKKNTSFSGQAEAYLREHLPSWRLCILDCDETGALAQ